MVTFDEFKKLEIRVAEIKSAADHPNANKLTVMQIDVGGEQKQIVAGIRGHYSNEELVGKKIVVVNNLAPAKLRGVESNGMILAAVAGDGAVVLLVPDKDVPAGTAVQ
ncbi:MAG: methionine--tRNA ligase subunit beta [Planctomycetota bacterium]